MNMCECARLYLGEGCYPLGQFCFHLRQSLSLPHGLLELLLREFQPLLQLPVLLLHLHNKQSFQINSVQEFI